MNGTLFHLVRHGAHDQVGRVLVGRMAGVALSQAGRAQAERVAGLLSGRAIVAVLSSPQPRAEATARVIAVRHGLEVELEGGLDEVDFGEWEGRAFEELEGDAGWRAWTRMRGLALTPGGEGMGGVQGRVLGVLARARARWPAGEVVMAGHQDVLRAALLGVLGAPLDLFGRMALEPGGIASVRLWADDARLEMLDNGDWANE